MTIYNESATSQIAGQYILAQCQMGVSYVTLLYSFNSRPCTASLQKSSLCVPILYSRGCNRVRETHHDHSRMTTHEG
jgi:hypothetical protein